MKKGMSLVVRPPSAAGRSPGLFSLQLVGLSLASILATPLPACTKAGAMDGTGGGSATGGMSATGGVSASGGTASGGSSGSGGGSGSGGASAACSPPTDMDQPPMKLSETGCMSTQTPTAFASMVFPYAVNSPLWSDAADKARGFVLPAGGKIHVRNCADASEDCLSGAGDPDDGKWVFPVGTVMVKNFGFDKKLVETRLFVHHDRDNWVGYSYAWSEDQSEATIVASEGAEVMFDTGSRKVDWHYPSRKNCMKCHKPTGGSTLGPETAQMNRTADAGGMNQIDQLQKMGAFENSVPTPYKAALATPYTSQAGEPSASTTAEQKARSYLHANCSFCHRPDDPDVYYMDMRFGVDLGDMGLCGQTPAKTDLGISGATRLDPGSPMTSLLWLRMNLPIDDPNVQFRMPPIASYVIDTDGVKVVGDWISGLSQPCPQPSSLIAPVH